MTHGIEYRREDFRRCFNLRRIVLICVACIFSLISDRQDHLKRLNYKYEMQRLLEHYICSVREIYMIDYRTKRIKALARIEHTHFVIFCTAACKE